MGILDFLKRRQPRQAQGAGALKVFSDSSNVITGKNSTAFSAVDLIASSFANLTGHFYRKETKEVIRDYFLYDVINEPNFDETKFLFFYYCAIDYFNGNVFLYLSPGEDGNVVSLFRLNPAGVKVKRGLENQKIYAYNGIEYDYRRILHIPSRYGYNGLIGKSIFDECNQIFSIATEIDTYVNNSFGNSVGNRLIIDITKEYPNATEEQLLQLRNKFLQNYSGIRNAGKPLIKSGKINYEKIETDFKDNRGNQLIENRNFQEGEIAKLFGVPLQLIKGEKVENIENIYTLFIENSIRPLGTIFEQGINKLIPMAERNHIYFEYNYNSLMKTNLTTRIDAYTKQLTSGVLSPNEIRRKENLPEITAGDNHFVPANLLPLREDVIEAYMAGAKIKQLQLESSTDFPDTQGNHSNLGDDKV
jgi:HK97 family phage portal protein